MIKLYSVNRSSEGEVRRLIGNNDFTFCKERINFMFKACSNSIPDALLSGNENLSSFSKTSPALY